MRSPDKFAATFKDFPPIQKPNTFTIDDALKMMQSAGGGRLTQSAGWRVRLAARLSAG